ncbi:uncharacterized protein LOC132457539 isoform X2 [Gadus macrocephalus]|uniref:uncharacterized protein LOC132457539 isoform X2 n=1 Tax=Gadus macrocephalus TaxID=80720 RepID=UPI0028CB5CBB|nr:uncharacterized protein LOC132457539 isoform X2 [Gadus macrocephalus]
MRKRDGGKRNRDCKTHRVMKELLGSFEKCSHCHGPFSSLKWWGLRCDVCTTVWHTYCFHSKDKREKTSPMAPTTVEKPVLHSPVVCPSTGHTPVVCPSTGHTPVISPSTGHTPVVCPSTSHTPVVCPSTGHTPVDCPSTGHTPVISPSTGHTPVVCPSTSHTPVVCPSTSHTPVVCPSTSRTPVVSPSTSHTPVVSPSTSHTPVLSSTVLPEENESNFSEEEALDDICDDEYVPDSESTDTEDEEPINSLANSTFQVAGESLMDTSMTCNVTDDTLVTEQSCTNTAPPTSVVRAGQNFCFVCKDFHSKIARHFKTHVQENSDIAYALSLPARSATRKKLLENLRNRGNFEYNRDVLKKGSGQLKVKRRAKKVESKKYEYCIHCKGMFLRPELWRHMKRCSSKPEEQEHQGRKRVLGLAAAIDSASSSTVENGVLKMLSRMHDDDIASVIRNDFCLLRYADTLFRKHGHDPSKHDYIRQKIRQLGRFLQTLRKRSSILTLEDAIKPGNFMEVIEAVKETAGFDKERNRYKTPSLALKIGHSLLKVSDIIHCHALIAGNDNLIKSSKAFQKLYTAKWSEFISHCALSTISDLKYNKPAKLPLTDDVTKFNKHLDKTVESATAALKKETTVQNYSSLAKAALTKIVLFNRRRVGEVSKIKMKNFLERIKETNTLDEVGLSEYEKKLCHYFERVELKGKRGRKVAMLLTPEMVNALNIIIEKRKECGVPDQNEFLFAVPNCPTHYRGHQCLRQLADECGAKRPEYLRSTQLRKAIATTSQILNLKSNELDQLADFMGHDISVHREFYRLSEPTIQSARISKLLLALEKGKMHELKGKSLDEIEDFTDDDDDDDESEQEQTTDNKAVEDCPRELNDMDTPEGDRLLPVLKVPKAKTRRQWTKAEENAVMRHFKSHVIKGNLASKQECSLCKECEPALKKRTIQNIRDFVRNKGLTFKRRRHPN